MLTASGTMLSEHKFLRKNIFTDRIYRISWIVLKTYWSLRIETDDRGLYQMEWRGFYSLCEVQNIPVPVPSIGSVN